jgi:multidrug efflux pump subunit AcrB
MKFTDIFIQRPVLATVVSLLILLMGLRSIGLLEVRQFPLIKNTVITVTTAYPGASSDLVKGFVTTPLQQAMSEANGIASRKFRPRLQASAVNCRPKSKTRSSNQQPATAPP